MLTKYTGFGMFAAYWPIMMRLSKTTKPLSCFLFTCAYAAAWPQAVSPFLTGRLQSSLNSGAAPFAQKYKIKGDAEYMQ